MRSSAALFACLLGLPLLAAAASARTLRLTTVPPRPEHGITGSEFAKRTDGWSEPDRQRAALVELERGNLPEWLGRLQPVELRRRARGAAITATIWVTPDYLAIGPDGDFLYIPLTWPSAARVARRFDCVLPTPRMVDAIHRQARIHLVPRPLPAGPEMRSSAYSERHQRLIDEQRAGIPSGALIAGHKKDLVLSDRLADRPDRVAIYGWHRPDGRPIQPLSTLHGLRYVDYSHGVRLVWHEVWIDGVPRSIYEVLADPELAPVLSDEGAIRDPRGLLDARRTARRRRPRRKRGAAVLRRTSQRRARRGREPAVDQGRGGGDRADGEEGRREIG